MLRLSAVADVKTSFSNRTGAVKINLTPKVNNDILTAPVYVTELLFEEGNSGEDVHRRFHERCRVIPIYLNYPTDITALQADISYKANNDGDFMVLLYSAIQEAPLVNPQALMKEVWPYTSYYGDEWITEPVVNKSWMPGDPISMACTRTLSNNTTWNRDGISRGWTFISTAGILMWLRKMKPFAHSNSPPISASKPAPTSMRWLRVSMAVSVHLPSSLSANAFIFNGLTSLGVSIIQAVVTTDGLLVQWY